MKRLLLLAPLLAAFSITPLQAQGTFRNLGFEEAQILPGDVTSNAIPGWSAFSGTNQLATIAYNNFFIFPIVGLYGSNSLVISGDFTLFISTTGSVSQINFVPADAQTLFFKSRGLQMAELVVSLGGQSLLYSSISTGANYTLYGVDISNYAGQTTTLKFLASGAGGFAIDDIEFSSQAIPEPSTIVLLVLSGLLGVTNRFCKRRSKRHY